MKALQEGSVEKSSAPEEKGATIGDLLKEKMDEGKDNKEESKD